jgi:hypothetical protein
MFLELSALFADAGGSLGTAFNAGLPFVLICTAALIVLHLAITIVRRGPRVERPPWSPWEKLVYVATLASVAGLGVTSFFTVMRFGAMHGWALFAHMVAAGLFVFVLPVLAITWCGVNRFAARSGSEQDGEDAPRFFWLPRATFWVIVAGGLVVTLTMLLSMLPVFGTEGLQSLLDVHRYAGLVVVVAMLLHLYSVTIQCLGLN